MSGMEGGFEVLENWSNLFTFKYGRQISTLPLTLESVM